MISEERLNSVLLPWAGLMIDNGTDYMLQSCLHIVGRRGGGVVGVTGNLISF